MVKIDRSPTKILVIRLSALGDVAMTVPVLSALAHQYPEIKVTVLTRKFYEPIFAQLPNVEVFVADLKGRHSGALGLWNLYKALKNLGFDAVVDLHNVLRSNVLRVYFRWGATPFYQIDKGRAEKKVLTSGKNKILKPLKTTHERYAEVFEQLGVRLDLAMATKLSKETLTDKVLTLVGSDATKWIAIAPFAAFEGKTYPMSLMEQVISGLEHENNLKVLLFGGGNKEVTRLEQLAQRHSNCINIAGKLEFADELALISNLDLMLSMDSGNGHLASMYGIPVVTIWGVTHPYAGFYPFGQDANNALLADRDQFSLIPTSVYGNKLPKGYEKAIATIHPKTVVAKVLEVLANA